jgi:hypothetical protein
MKRQLGVGLGILGLVLVGAWFSRTVRAQGAEWPLEIEGGGAHIVLYQPQPESLEADRLSARAAVSVEREGDAAPRFGAIWFEARVSTDRDARSVTILDVRVLGTRFPGATPEQESALAKTLQEELPKQQHTFSLDRLLTTLDEAVGSDELGTRLQHAPPRIVLARQPTVLVTLDGQPRMQAIQGSRVMRIVNTPFVILFDPAERTYHLQAGERWVKAQQLEGPWVAEPRAPVEVSAVIPPRSVEADPGAQFPKDSPDAAVLVVTEPTELVVCSGEPQWTPLPGNELLYLANSENDAFIDLGSQQVFLLLAGRWYASPALEKGPWSHVPADELPAGFARIPPDSAKGAVRSFVAGTDEARDALLDAAIPQTSEVKRGEARCSVSYDGEPRFEPIQGTRLKYAVNTSSSVIECDGRFYCCSQAVWFVSESPLGPWIVCADVPAEIYEIPPSSPVFPVRYVYVYDSTPEVVYVGYLPGYVGCYAAGPTIVYGTGYWYPGWWGSVYYPRPCTWGFRAHYNPWSCGWSLGFGFGWGVHPGWFAFSVGWGQPGWWGHDGFCGSRFEIHGGHVHLHSHADPAFVPDMSRVRVGNNNIYKRSENRARIRASPSLVPQAPKDRATGQRPNDVYVDGQGRVLRGTNDGWQERGPSGWKPPERAPTAVPPSTGRGRPAQPPPVKPAPGQRPGPANPLPQTRPGPLPPHNDLERMRQAREHGDARASTIQKGSGQAAPRGGKPRG